MVRKQIYIQADRDRVLKARARELGVSEAELVRQGIDKVLSAPARDELRRTAWQRIMQSIENRKKMKVPQTRRTWTREELYDERPKYLSGRH